MGPGDVMGLLILVGGISSIFVLRGPLGRALADRIAGRASADRDAAQVRELADRVVAELDDVRQRLMEIEERQDFAERMLAQQKRSALPAEREG